MTRRIDFTRALIKGKIAEIVFEQILREIGGYTVLNFGYEKVLPELSKFVTDKVASKDELDRTLDIIRRAPDYAVINHKLKKVSLIEIKWMTVITTNKVLQIAEKMSDSWNPSSLFIATPENFFFGEIEDIIKSKGQIEQFVHPKFDNTLKIKYLKIINDFEAPSAFEDAD